MWGVWWGADEDAFSPEEAKVLKDLLRKIGERRFIDETIRNGTVTAKKLLTAFGIRPVGFSCSVCMWAREI